MKLGWLMLVVALGAPAFGQISVEEAQAKLAQKSRATTQPSAETLSEYRQVIAELRAENAKLRAQLTQLQSQLADARKGPVTAPASPAAQANAQAIHKAIREHRLEKGMTRLQAEQAMGKKPTEKNDTSSGEELTWRFFLSGAVGAGPGGTVISAPSSLMREVSAIFAEGVLVSFEDRRFHQDWKVRDGDLN